MIHQGGINQQSKNSNSNSNSKMTPPLPGGCYCGAVRYTITLDDPATQARTSLCHCGNCKRFTGGEHGITTKIPRAAFALAQGRDALRVHEADNGSGTHLHREFCGTCGGPLLEYGVRFCGFLLFLYIFIIFPPLILCLLSSSVCCIVLFES